MTKEQYDDIFSAISTGDWATAIALLEGVEGSHHIRAFISDLWADLAALRRQQAHLRKRYEEGELFYAPVKVRARHSLISDRHREHSMDAWRFIMGWLNAQRDKVRREELAEEVAAWKPAPPDPIAQRQLAWNRERETEKAVRAWRWRR